MGSKDDQVVGSDRFSAYEWIKAFWRQVCWAHLRRDFQAMIDRGGEGESIGQRLLSLSNRLFRHWHRVRDGTLPWNAFQERMHRLRREVKQTLLEGSRCPCAKTAATCFELLKVEEGLWTFARVQGIAPTNNAVERALRHAVIWRRISGGTDSVHGSRFVERMLTVVATCRQQGHNVLDYLTSCFEADRRGQALPSLLPTHPDAIQSCLIPPIPPYERLRPASTASASVRIAANSFAYSADRAFRCPTQRTAIKAPTRLCPVAQPVVRHGQEEQVEGIELSLAGGQALFQDCDRLGEPAGAVEGDAQGVEIHLFPRASRTAWRACSTASAGLRSGSGAVTSSQARLLWARAGSGHRSAAWRSTPMASPILPACSNCRAWWSSDSARLTILAVRPRPHVDDDLQRRGWRVSSRRFGFGVRGRVPVEAHLGELACGWPAGPRRARPGRHWWSPPAATRRG